MSGLRVSLMASNGRHVFTGDVTEAHHHTWLGMFLGQCADGRRVLVNVTREYTEWSVNGATGPWRRWWHDPAENEAYGKDGPID